MSLAERARFKTREQLDRVQRARRERRLLDTARTTYRDFLAPGDLCFDVGANVGNRTRIFLELGARVVAIEPQRACADELRARYGPRAELVVVEAALGPRAGEAELLQTRYDTIATLSTGWVESVRSTGRFPFEWSTKTVVPVTTLDVLISDHGVPSFCKLDVEGYEAEVLAGLTHSIPAVAFEVTPEFVDSGIACVRRLAELGAREFAFSEGESMRLGRWVAAPEMETQLRELPADGVMFGDVYARL